jgi:hypothetical protein
MSDYYTLLNLPSSVYEHFYLQNLNLDIYLMYLFQLNFNQLIHNYFQQNYPLFNSYISEY